MATELQKPQQPEEQIAIYKRLYSTAWEQAFNEFMFLMAEQYGMELLIEAGEKQVPSPTVKFWRESLEKLSPSQMHEGLRGYMRSERGRFKPTPGEIEENAPEADDKPRKTTNPKCQDCSGTGFRMVEQESRLQPGKKFRAAVVCYCVRIEYGGNTYTPAPKQLSAAPTIPDAELVARLEKKIPGISEVAKDFQAAGKPLSDADYNARQQELARQKSEAAQIAEKYRARSP